MVMVMSDEKRGLDVIRGTLDLLVLKAVSLGPMHGYAISKWIHGVTGEELLVEEGSLYPALYRLDRKNLIESRWSRTETGRRARVYELTSAGSKRLNHEIRYWERYVKAMERAVSSVAAGVKS